MRHWLTRNLGMMLVALLLAFFFWAVATESENPTDERPFNTPVPLEIEGLAEGMIAYDLQDTQVRVELKAPISVWGNLTLADIYAYLDLSGVMTGTQSVPVQVDVRINPLRVLSVTPAQVTLKVEPIAEKEVSVTAILQGTPAFGYKADAALISPQLVRVQGPASLVSQVEAVQVEVLVQDLQSDVRSDYQPLPVDADGNAVVNVEVVPKNVTVNVSIWQLGYIRDLAVTVALDGQPALGYRVANLEVFPQVIKVFGRTEVVRSAQGYLQTQPINMEGITRSLTTTVALQMPEGLSVILPAKPEITVSLSIEAIQSGLTLDVRPQIQGLSDAFSATVGIESVVVILSGPLAIMDELDVNDVLLSLDLTNLLPGDYTIVPIISLPEGITVESLIPEAVPVKIEPLRLEEPGLQD